MYGFLSDNFPAPGGTSGGMYLPESVMRLPYVFTMSDMAQGGTGAYGKRGVVVLD